jgi:hypothetical protein
LLRCAGATAIWSGDCEQAQNSAVEVFVVKKLNNLCLLGMSEARGAANNSSVQ